MLILPSKCFELYKVKQPFFTELTHHGETMHVKMSMNVQCRVDICGNFDLVRLFFLGFLV
jgi:hypothetical protein